MRDRKLNKAYAQMTGYFWTDCPMCGQEFGGHEWKSYSGKELSMPDPEHLDDGRIGTAICPDCVKAGVGNDIWREWELLNGSRYNLQGN